MKWKKSASASSHDGRALSVKALRLYDELGVLVPSRVDGASGYRYYDVAQLEEARLVAMLRQSELPLAAIKELLVCDPVDAAARIAEYWQEVDSAHDAAESSPTTSSTDSAERGP